MRLHNLDRTALAAALALLALGAAAQADVFNMGGARNANGTWTGLASEVRCLSPFFHKF
jgi:hypothetical protein